MAKQGLLVVVIQSMMPPHRAHQYCQDVQRAFSELGEEFSENYDLAIIPASGDSGTVIKVLPYKDYVFDLETLNREDLYVILEQAIKAKLTH